MYPPESMPFCMIWLPHSSRCAETYAARPGARLDCRISTHLGGSKFAFVYKDDSMYVYYVCIYMNGRYITPSRSCVDGENSSRTRVALAQVCHFTVPCWRCVVDSCA